MNRNEKETRKPNPHNDANRLSKMTWWYLRDLYKVGYSRPITQDDIYQTIQHHESQRIGERFTNLWNQELKTQNPSIIRLFYNAYGPSVLTLGILFSISETINRCFQPLFLGAFLNYFIDEPMPKEEAYMYAGAIVLCSLIPVLTFNPFIHFIFEVGMKLRVGCSRLIYDKVSLHFLFSVISNDKIRDIFLDLDLIH
jgi:ATP-binding cassette, subfamily C (CFTR/MRP), member 4